MTLSSYLPASLRSLQDLQRGFPPVPDLRFSDSMLLPSLHSVLLWCTPLLIECQGLTVGIRPTSSLNRLAQNSRDDAGKSTKRRIMKWGNWAKRKDPSLTRVCCLLHLCQVLLRSTSQQAKPAVPLLSPSLSLSQRMSRVSALPRTRTEIYCVVRAAFCPLN